MKRLFLIGATFGIALSALGWALSLLLTAYFQLNDSQPSFLNESDYQEISEDLVSFDQVGQPSLDDISYEYDVLVVEVEPLGTDAADQMLASEIKNEWYSFEDQGYYLFLLDNNRLFEASLIEYETLFALGHWLQLLFHCLAILATVAFMMMLVNQRLKPLEGMKTVPSTADAETGAKDPVNDAVQALAEARREVQTLKDKQRDMAADHRDLLASVAHEFRNPLARLQFANEMAMERTGDEQNALHLEANHAAIELDDLVRETLRYSRLSNLDEAPILEPVSVIDLLRVMADFKAAPDTKAELSIEYPTEDVYVNADRRLIERALGNLVSNALRYANQQVIVSAAEKNGLIHFDVADDGPGIAVAHQQRLFEPFYRVERSRSRETGGFGLGLSIVKSICDKHGAEVRLTSGAEGTKFTLTWPLAA